MRIGCLQFAPQVGDVDNNLNRADAVLNRADPQDLDLLVLPELAFSGYNFKSLEQISSFLEPSGSGISALWARTTALKYDCHVAVGYPEKIDPTNNWPTSPEYYNSALIVNGDGETVANYRKTHLYYTDETWALEGNHGFYEGYIPGLGHTSMGICMDLNPYKFEAPWDDFEFGYHVLECQSNVVIVSMAWMTREDPRMFSRMPNEPDMETLTYWVTRLEPLIRMEDDDEIIVIFANRCGIEGDAVYAGTSAVVGIQDGEVRVYGVLGRGEKELLVVDTNNPPQAKLIYRPTSDPTVAHGELQPSESATSPRSSRSKQSQPSSQQQPIASVPDPQVEAAQTLSTHIAAASPTSSPQQKRRDRPKPQLQIPIHPSQQTATASAVSTKSMADDIPTPSAPSPTPHNVRPKITIPQPSQQPVSWQAFSPVPMSAQSTQSVQSVQSNTSSSSRRPEDSTPYPHGSDPYNSPRLRTIYGGDVTITRKGFSPTTPFEDASPVAMRHVWAGGSLAESIAESDAQSSVGMSSARQRPRRAFQDWPQLQPRHGGTPQPPENNQQVAAQQPKRVSPSKQTAHGSSVAATVENSRPSPSASDRQSSKNEDHVPSTSTTLPTRPSSPKSRNASRTGNRERSDSALAHRNVEVEIDQLLETITRRAESVNRSRNKDTSSPLPGRPSSRRAHARSSSRPTETTASIMIGANPAVLGQEIPRSHTESVKTGPRGPPRTTSRLGHRARSASLSDSSQFRARSRTPAQHGASPETSSRGVSRGRKPGPHEPAPPVQLTTDVLAEASRPGSARAQRKTSISQQVGVDSAKAGSVRSRNHLVSRHAKLDPSADSPRSVEGSRHHTPHGSGPGTPLHRSIRVEHESDQPTICPNCSTKIPCTSKPSPRAINTSFGDLQQTSPRHGMVMNRAPLHIADMSSERSASLDSRASLPESFVVVSESESLAETLETTSTTGDSPATPGFMDPCTPKAMLFIRDDDDGKPNPPSPDDKGPSPVCVTKEIVV